MPPSVSTPHRLSFGSFEADLHSGELRKHGIKVPLQSQPFQLLAMLLERPGQLVTREAICQRLWPADTFVDFDHSLGTAINKIREVLNDSATEPRFVETLPRRGYRFIALVVVVAEPPQAVLPSPSFESETNGEDHPHPAPRSLIWAGASVVLLFSALAGWYFLRQRPHPVESIAVLPLSNLSADPNQQFFPDGVTDELITNLAQIASLRVISHTSAMAYAGTRKSAPQIARELGVDALVEGSVARSGDRVRITVQLIQAASDRHLWAHTYDLQLSDVLTVQSEVAREIAENISLRLTPQERFQLTRSRPISPEVALLYFKGSYYLNKLDAFRAREIFTQAIRLDPNSTESWAGLADALHTMGVQGDYEAFPQAKEAANKALAIDSSQPQALMVLGIVSFIYDWNPAVSEAYFRRSLTARPGYAMARALFATTLAHHGKFDEAIQQIKLANASDPVSLLTNSMAWQVYFSARRYDDALRIIRGTVDLDPNFGPANEWLARSWEQKGEYQKAIEAAHPDAREAARLKAALASEGPDGYWKRKLKALGGRDGRYGYAMIARYYMHLGKREEALETLEEGYRRRDPFLIFWLPICEEFDPLRSDPRFQEMLNGLGAS